MNAHTAGYGDTQDRGDDPSRALDVIGDLSFAGGAQALRLVDGHGSRTCVMLDSGESTCFGYNFYGCVKGDCPVHLPVNLELETRPTSTLPTTACLTLDPA